MHLSPKKVQVSTGILSGIAALGLYSYTMAPDLMANDCSEWQATALTLGINHAPGSPAYTIIGHLFAIVPIGNPAARLTFLSVMMGAAGVMATYYFVQLLLGRLLPAIAAAATLGLSAMWWGHASVPTPYNVVPTFMAITFLLLLLWSRSQDNRLLWIGALLAGVGCAYHPTMIFFLPVPLVGIFLLGPWRRLLKPKPVLILILMFMAGLSIYLYIPFRSAMDPQIMTTKVDSVSGFFEYVSASPARENRQDTSLMPEPEEIGDRVREVVLFSYHPWYVFFILAPAALLALPSIRRRLQPISRWLGLLFAGMLTHSLLLFFFTDIYSHYYLPMLFYFSVWAGVAVYLIEEMKDEFSEKTEIAEGLHLFILVVLVGVLLMGTPKALRFANHRHDNDMRNYVDFVFSQAEQNAVVLATWDTWTGLMYSQKIEGQRTDIVLNPLPTEKQRESLPYFRKAYPDSQILMSVAFNIYSVNDIWTYGADFPLGIKSLTNQNFQYGEPYPMSARLIEPEKDL